MFFSKLLSLLSCAAVAHGGETLYNILATRHVNGGGDACALPSANYDVQYPFALGSIDELSYLKFRPGIKLCIRITLIFKRPIIIFN